MESEIPEVVVFFNANDQCQLFKDVGIDGEVPCHDYCCVRDCELDHNNISNLLKYELVKTNTDVTEEVVLYISTAVEESFSNHHCLQEDFKLCGAQNKLMEDKAGFGASADIANVHPSKEESFRSQNVDTDDQINKFSLFQLLKATDELEDARQNHQEQIRNPIPAESLTSGKEGGCNISNAVESRNEMGFGAECKKNEEGKSTRMPGVEQPPEAEDIYEIAMRAMQFLLLGDDSSNCFQEQIRDTIPAESLSSGKEGECNISNAVESRKEMGFGAECTNNEEGKSTRMSGVEQPPEAEDIYDNGAHTLEKPLLSSSSFSHKNTLGVADVGSSSFSAATTSSGRLTFSGSALNSDNISLRSNSTTSTSFAFPILATEWHESPRRMAEIDGKRRKKSKKCRCWSMCFSCSNF